LGRRARGGAGNQKQGERERNILSLHLQNKELKRVERATRHATRKADDFVTSLTSSCFSIFGVG